MNADQMYRLNNNAEKTMYPLTVGVETMQHFFFMGLSGGIK